MRRKYNSGLPIQDLIYLDANNPYGHAMLQYLPSGGFRLLESEEVEALDLQTLSDEADDGYIYEVELHYPTKLHKQHDDYPLAPESITIDSSMYSPIQASVYPKSPPDT